MIILDMAMRCHFVWSRALSRDRDALPSMLHLEIRNYDVGSQFQKVYPIDGKKKNKKPVTSRVNHNPDDPAKELQGQNADRGEDFSSIDIDDFCERLNRFYLVRGAHLDGSI